MARFKTNIQSYDCADRFLGTRNERQLAHNTTVSRFAVWIDVQYHWTVIVRYYRDGRVRLDSGGWQTVTTKQRINELLPPGFRLLQKDFRWYVEDCRDCSFEGLTKAPLRRSQFRDGMTINPASAPGEAITYV